MDWIANHRSGPARVGWEAYPTSLRLTNWCTLFFGRYRTGTLADEELRETLWASLCEQADHLQRNVEWHLLGNHLLENAIALTLAESCFKHPVAESWFRKGREILERQLPEQILDDGGHFERSPMYQSRVLYALLLLSEAGDRLLTKLVEPYLGPLAGSLAAMTHPDGGIALFNDSAFGVYPRPRELVERVGLEPQRVGSFALTESGYYSARTVTGHYIICDAGPIGPDYQPGHGHADLFSFELSLRGARVVGRQRGVHLRSWPDARLLPVDSRAQHGRDRRPGPSGVVGGLPGGKAMPTSRSRMEGTRRWFRIVGTARRLPTSVGTADAHADLSLASGRQTQYF